MLLFHPLISIKRMQTNEAIVNSHGVRIHAMRPPLPMLAVVRGKIEYWMYGSEVELVATEC